jgi:hypothetical protein
MAGSLAVPARRDDNRSFDLSQRWGNLQISMTRSHYDPPLQGDVDVKALE